MLGFIVHGTAGTDDARLSGRHAGGVGRDSAVSLLWIVASYDLGEALANFVQPFFTLPILGLFQLRARDVMGYTMIVFLALTPVVLILVTVLGLTRSYPLQAGSRRSAPPDAPARRSRRR